MSFAIVISTDPSPPPPASGAPPGAPPGAAPFHSALEDQMARTATAEGHKGEDRSDGARPHRREAAADTSEPVAATAVSAPAGDAQAPVRSTDSARQPGTTAANTASPPAGSVAAGPAPEVPSETVDPQSVPASARPSDGARAVEPTPGPSLSAAPSDAPVASGAAPHAGAGTDSPDQAAAATNQPSVSTGAETQQPGSAPPAQTSEIPGPAPKSQTPEVSGTPTPAPPPVPGREPSSGSAPPAAPPTTQTDGPLAPSAGPAPASEVEVVIEQHGPHGEEPREPRSGAIPAPLRGMPGASERGPAHAPSRAPSAEPMSQGPPAGSTPAPSAGAQVTAAVSHVAASAPASSEAPAPPTATAAAQGAPVSSAPAGAAPEGPLLGSGVAMADAIESIRATVALAARQGMASARIALHPDELGEIRIHLTQTRDGLLARVSADEPVAMRALLAERSELAHALRGLGGSLSLDIGSSGHQDIRGQNGHAAARDTGDQRLGAVGAAPEEADGEPAADLATPAEIPKGALVDVLA